MDRIQLTGMEFKGYHGCLPAERQAGQIFFLDLVLEMDLRPAGESDRLDKTVNYAEVFETVRSVVEGEPLNLIEAVAEKTASEVLAKFAELQAVEVTVHKPYAPIDGKFRDASVTIRRERSHV